MQVIYLDYSATTKMSKKTLAIYQEVSDKYFGNANSLHELGRDSKKVLLSHLHELSKALNIAADSLIITSGATESNNLAIDGVLSAYPNRGRVIVTTKIEHSSIQKKLEELKDLKVIYLDSDKEGRIYLSDLKKALEAKPALVSICAVDSEMGITQDIEAIKKLVREYPQTLIHVDATQAIGKINFDFTDLDLVSFSAHKCYGPVGVGFLYKADKVVLTPTIIGGESLSEYRAGTTPVALASAASIAIKEVVENLEQNKKTINQCHEILKKGIEKYPGVILNSTTNSVKQIVNLSVLGIKGSTLVNAFSNRGIMLSSMSACHKNATISKSVLALTKSKKRASSTIRVSLSHYTKLEEIEAFLRVLDEIYFNTPKGGI